jgi:hypothetical protein
VLYSGNAPVLDKVLAPLEAQWPKNLPYRPSYASFSVLGESEQRFVGKSTELRRRVFGISPVSGTAANARFVLHYNETFTEKTARSFAPNTTYDAFYLMAYATHAVPRGEPITGDRLARAISRLVPPGKPVDVGMSGIFDAYNVLRSGHNIDLNGATGRLDLNAGTGETSFDYSILCFASGEDARSSEAVESGLVYASTSKKMQGTMRCP